MGHLRQRAMPYCLRYFIGATPQAPIHICKTQERSGIIMEPLLQKLADVLQMTVDKGQKCTQR